MQDPPTAPTPIEVTVSDARLPRRYRPLSAFRSERLAAILLLACAAAGVALANSPIGGALAEVRDIHVGPRFLGLDLSLGHWVTDGLLALFFFTAAIELRHELTRGELDTPRKAFIPAIAAVGGVIAPAAIFLIIAGSTPEAVGWPIPTATDIAFALGVLALVGRGLPPRVRALLLALAVIDDLIAILLIAVLFTTDLQPLALLGAVPVVLAFGFLARRLQKHRRAVTVPALVLLGLIAWALVYTSGVHATIAGVALGLVMPVGAGGQAKHLLDPWINGIVLPLFAFTASLVVLPSAGLDALEPVFWGILIALPLGKLVGITVAGLIAVRLVPRSERASAPPLGDLLVVATLGGIGFTVALLMNELAFRGSPDVAAQGTIAVLAGSLISIVAGVVTTAIRARSYRAQRVTAS